MVIVVPITEICFWMKNKMKRAVFTCLFLINMINVALSGLHQMRYYAKEKRTHSL